MANAVTSNTGSVASPVATFKIRYAKKVFLYVDYAKGDGTSATMTIGFVKPKVHASNLYQETAFATANMAPITATFNATGRFRFEITPATPETSLVVTFAFTGGTTQAIICDVVPE